MIIPLKNIVENIEEPLKSPRRMSPELTQRYKMGKKYESSQLNNYIRAFRKEIQLPINYQTSIFLSKTPQRCLNHNSVITLFCLDDKKPLCAHCMYQAFSHKKHQIVPINKVTHILKQQLQNSLQSIVCVILPKINKFKTKNEIKMAKISKQIHEHIFLVNKFYQDLVSFIISKKNEHIKYCQQVQNRFKNQHHSFSTQLNRTLQFLQDKVKEISQRNTDENLLFNHNTAFYLTKVDSILVPSISQFPPLQTKEIQQKIETIRKDLNEVLSQSFKLLKLQERKKSLQKTQSLPKNQKFMLWKSKSPQIFRQEGQNFHSQKSLHQRFSYKDIPKSLFTQREDYLNDKNSLKKQRKSKDNKPSFIFHFKQISEQSQVNQQSTLHTKRIKSKKQDRRIVTSKDR